MTRTFRRGGQSFLDFERLGDEAVEAEAVRLQVGGVGDGGQQMDLDVMQAVGGERQVMSLRQVGDFQPGRDAAAVGNVGLGKIDSVRGDQGLEWLNS